MKCSEIFFPVCFIVLMELWHLPCLAWDSWEEQDGEMEVTVIRFSHLSAAVAKEGKQEERMES